MTDDYARHLTIAAPPERVFDALTRLDGLRGWWTGLVTGAPLPGGELRFRFAGLDEHIDMRVDQARRPDLVRWTCLIHSDLPDWAGTQLCFDIRAHGPEATELRFAHRGLTPQLACFDECRAGWEHFLPSLAAFVETGRGSPFPFAASEPHALGIVRAYHDAWTSGAYAEAGHYLAEDLTTDVPLNTYATKQDFLQAVQGFGELATRVDLLAEFGQADEALLLYDVAVPAIGTLRVAEHFVLSEGQIRQIRHVHDTAALRAAGFARTGSA